MRRAAGILLLLAGLGAATDEPDSYEGAPTTPVPGPPAAAAPA